MTNKYWLFCLLVLSIISFASITASNEFVTAPQYGAVSHSANNQPQWVPSNAAASSSSATASGDDHSHFGDGHSHTGGHHPHSSPSSLTAHHGCKQCLTEDPSKIFVCTLCSHRFRRQERLKRHYHSLHTHDKPFECTDCGKKFSCSDDVNQHQRTHGAGTVVMGVMTSDSGIYGTWWIALVVISVVMFIHKINQRRQRVNNIAALHA